MAVAQFNALSEDAAAELLAACCSSTVWVAELLAGRPYSSEQSIQELSRRLLSELDWSGIRQALDAHPRIGGRVAGAGREATWSRSEQAGTADSSAQTKAELVEANRAYEERFGHVFLIFATGKTDVEMLTAARRRLEHDDATERAIVRDELSRIVALRLERALRG